MTLIMFPLIMAMDMFWNKFALALLFPLAMMVLVPISLSSSRPDGPHEPKVSCAMGIKWLSLASSHFYCLPQEKAVDKRALFLGGGSGDHFALTARNSNKKPTKATKQ